MADDPFDLQRFVDAQAPVYERVRAELRNGRKQSHWMWFIFPQIAGLGHSAMAQRYAISCFGGSQGVSRPSGAWARIARMHTLRLQIDGRSAYEILGSPDDMKFHSCMTLFARAAPQEDVFMDALEKYFDGAEDQATVARLR